MNNKHKTFNEKEIDILNEMSDENVIYEETQCGPQEEMIITEHKIDIDKWRKYKNNKKWY